MRIGEATLPSALSVRQERRSASGGCESPRLRLKRSQLKSNARSVSMKLILYVKKGCPYCKAVMDYLDGNKISYEKIEVRGTP